MTGRRGSGSAYPGPAASPTTRIVVGEAADPPSEDLRITLDDGDFTVVARASDMSQLEAVVEREQPDVVVLDAEIGAAAVLAVREAAPGAGIVAIWPAAVSAAIADVQVEPSKIATDLVPAVTRIRRISAIDVTPEAAVAVARTDVVPVPVPVESSFWSRSALILATLLALVMVVGAFALSGIQPEQRLAAPSTVTPTRPPGSETGGGTGGTGGAGTPGGGDGGVVVAAPGDGGGAGGLPPGDGGGTAGTGGTGGGGTGGGGGGTGGGGGGTGGGGGGTGGGGGGTGGGGGGTGGGGGGTGGGGGGTGGDGPPPPVVLDRATSCLIAAGMPLDASPAEAAAKLPHPADGLLHLCLVHPQSGGLVNALGHVVDNQAARSDRRRAIGHPSPGQGQGREHPVTGKGGSNHGSASHGGSATSHGGSTAGSHSGSPGHSGDAPGHSGSSHGHSGDAPGHGGSSHGHSGEAHGHGP